MISPDFNMKTRTLAWEYGLFFLAALLLYSLTCAPTVLWQDSGYFYSRIWYNDLHGQLGLALSHPLYILVGMLVKGLPALEYGHRINLISAFFGALTVANVFLLLRLWQGSRLPAAIGAVSLCVSWTFWQYCCIAEVVSLYTALFTAELLFLCLYLKKGSRRYLWALGLLNGLAIANHMWGIIPLFTYVLLLAWRLWRRELTLGQLGLFVVCWLAGTLPYLVVIVQYFQATGDAAQTIASIFFGDRYGSDVLNVSLTPVIILENLIFIVYNYPGPNLLLGVAGLVYLCRKEKRTIFHVVLAGITLLFFVFAFRYSVPDRYSFFIPFYCVFSILVGVGCQWLLHDKRKMLSVVLLLSFITIPLYASISLFTGRFNFRINAGRDIPYRDEVEWFLQPWRNGYRGAERFALEALAALPDDGVLVADGTTVYALWYIQTVKGHYSEKTVLSDHPNYPGPDVCRDKESFDDMIAEHPVYVVSPVAGYSPEYILKNYDVEPAGVIWKVLERTD